jgi:beta-glucosidase
VSELKFPPNFSWGVATSAYQIEGAATEDGRGPSIWDTFSHQPGKTFEGHTGDVACDHYHRYDSDVDLIASLGVDAYRFSISWSRVQPKGHGAWNEKGLAFYDRLVDKLLSKGIKPHVTLYHWDLPQGLQDLGGWGSRDTTDCFADYADVIGRRFGDRVASICTHNEPWCTAHLGHHVGQFAPGDKDPQLAIQVAHHLLLSHGKALQAMRASGVKAPLGIVLNQSSVTAATPSQADRDSAERQYASFVRWYMDPIFLKRYPTAPGLTIYPTVAENDFNTIAQPLDFLGINYYTRIWASESSPPVPAPNAMGVNDMGWETYPQGLSDLLQQIDRDYDLPPIYITENGFAGDDHLVGGKVADSPRIAYVHTHLAALQQAMEAGVDIRGYFYWSLFDNYEWNSGYAKRFGIVHVDYENQQRTLKDSAHWYSDLIRKGR